MGGDWLRQGNRYVRARGEVAESSQTSANSKCEQSSTGNLVTYSDGRLAARLRSRSLSAVRGADA